MASPNDVPRVAEPIAGSGGFVTRAWLDFFLKLASTESQADLAALYAALAARVSELEENEGFSFQIIGQGAVSVNGTPQPGGFVVISLDNDVDNPGSTMYYGTGPTGERGWFPVSGTMLVEAGQLTKTVASNGVTTFGLADVADSGTGTLLATTFDAKGRKMGSKPATITGTASQIDVANGNAAAGLPTISLADLANSGAGTLRAYTRDAKGRISGDKAATITGTTNQISVANGDASAGLPTLSLAAAVLASLGKADSAVQSVVAGTGISVNNTNPQNPIVSSTVTIPAHNALSSLQGGTSGQYYHLTSAELALVGLIPSKYDKIGGTIGGATAGSDPVRVEGSATGYVGIDIVNLNASTTTIGRLRFVTSNKNIGFLAGAAGTVGEDGFSIYDYTLNVPMVFASAASFRPGADNTRSLGTAAARWSVVYAGTGSINTSDAREKTPVRSLTTNEIEAACALAGEIGAYKWLSSIEKKGDGARWHVGFTVQKAIQVMESFGLDAFSYGFICHDSWDASPEIWEDDEGETNERGEVIRPPARVLVRAAREAGDIYSFRPDGLQSFIIRGLVENQSRLDSRITAIENKLAPM